MNYIQIVVFLYIIIILFFVSIIGCHNCSYSAILIVFCTFKFSSMTLSLSLLHVHWILCYRIKNISFMVFIKQLKPRIFVQCNCCYTDWSLAGSIGKKNDSNREMNLRAKPNVMNQLINHRVCDKMKGHSNVTKA